jgi:hypothetical protein
MKLEKLKSKKQKDLANLKEEIKRHFIDWHDSRAGEFGDDLAATHFSQEMELKFPDYPEIVGNYAHAFYIGFSTARGFYGN